MTQTVSAGTESEEYSTYTLDQLVSLYDWMADQEAQGANHYYESMVEVSHEIERRADPKMPS